MTNRKKQGQSTIRFRENKAPLATNNLTATTRLTAEEGEVDEEVTVEEVIIETPTDREPITMVNKANNANHHPNENPGTVINVDPTTTDPIAPP